MKKILAIISLLLLCNSAHSQTERCVYIPLEFEEVTPLWTHLTIDSSIIGYIDTCAEWQEVYTDGMEQFSTDGGSFVEGDFLYSITTNEIDRDVSGVFAEKIDLVTGELKWKIIQDIRTVPYREQVFRGAVEEDNFVLYGLREAEPSKVSSIPVRFSGQLSGIYYKRIYDLETGELLSYETPELADSLAHDIRKSVFATESYFTKDSSVHFLDARNFSIGKGFNLIREITDTIGHLISERDTVVMGRFSDRPLLEGNIHDVPQLKKSPENTYVYIEQYSPLPEFDHTYEAILTEYDKDFNVIRELDLKTIGLDTFSQLTPVRVTEDYILIKGCYNLNFAQSTYCNEFYLVLDREFNLVYRFETKEGEVELGFLNPKNIIKKAGNTFYMPFQTFLDEGQSLFKLYRSTEDGYVELFKTLTIKESEWVGFVEHISILDNGDFLMKMTHSCYVDGRKRSWHPEWFRFAAADMEGMSSTESIEQAEQPLSLSPNPVTDRLRVESEEPIVGVIEIHDADGRLRASLIGSGLLEEVVDVSLLSPGSYFLTLRQRDGAVLSRHFVKL